MLEWNCTKNADIGLYAGHIVHICFPLFKVKGKMSMSHLIPVRNDKGLSLEVDKPTSS